jgi:hypothetical protein
MAFVTADRVLDSSTSTGTGAFVVSGTPAAGYRTFSAVMSVGDTCYYSIQGQTTSEWEVGLGTYSSANTLTRTTVYSSSNAGAAVTFSAGTKNVFITMVASKSPQLDPTGNVTALGTPASATLTNATGLSLTTGVTGVLPSANGGSLAWQSVQASNFTAAAGNAYPVNTTSAAITVTLPASPSAGNIVQLTDYAGTWATNYVTVAPNGSKINGATSSFFPIINRESLALVYIDATQGWLIYSGVNVTNPFTYAASYLVVAGGGGGGAGGGGGGAGGVLSGTSTLTAGTSYTITVGAGGSAAPTAANTSTVQGTDGNSSVFSAVNTVGGGGGGSVQTVTTSYNSGRPGGSGGGGGVSGIAGTGGSGTSGQGFAGGANAAASPAYGGGGGGGASAVGVAGSSSAGGGAGGAGASNSITGSSVTYAGGGGGGGYTVGVAGSGGTGGGGAGGANTTSGTAATANTGGGGGGGGQSLPGTAYSGGNGGSGVVILSVPTAFYSGTTTGSPTITTSGSNTIIKFTASGSYTA